MPLNTCRKTVKKMTAMVAVRNMSFAGTVGDIEEARPKAIAPRSPP